MKFVLMHDPQEFASRARRFTAKRIECNVLATVLMGVLDGVYGSVSPLFASAVSDDGDVEAVALRVPPWFLLTSELDATAADELIETWLGADPELPGVNGVPETARALAAAWNRQTGGTTRCRMREAMHVLQDAREPPRPARGQLRLASAPDRTLLVAWMDAFVHEAGVIGSGQSEAMVDARLGRGGLLVWDDRGPVSLVGRSPPVAGVVRIGPVYTPPERRRRGYGASAVAAASRRSLAEGASKCMLLTDLSNPTSNKIYAEIGYTRFGDWEEHEFLTS